MFRYLKLGISTRCRQNKGEKGFSLVEVLIAIGLLGVVAVPLLMALATSFKAGSTADSQSVAMSLAQSQLESVKGETYQSAPFAGATAYTKINSGNYTISTVNYNDTTVDNAVYGVPWDSGTGVKNDTDTGLQKIKIIIKQGNNIILTLETYKVNR